MDSETVATSVKLFKRTIFSKDRVRAACFEAAPSRLKTKGVRGYHLFLVKTFSLRVRKSNMGIGESAELLPHIGRAIGYECAVL